MNKLSLQEGVMLMKAKKKFFTNSVCLFLIWMFLFNIVSVGSLDKVYGYNYASRGIDVSVHQGNITWSSVANSGIDFAIIRAGSTNINAEVYGKDSKFETNYSGAKNAGIKVGAYYYCGAYTLNGFQKNARDFLNSIKGKNFEYPVFIDIEAASKQQALGKATLTTYILSALQIIQDAGYKAGLYANRDWMTNYIDVSRISSAGYVLWMAQYPSGSYAVNPSSYDKSSQCSIWQYSSLGSVSGINGNVDVDVSYTNFNTTISKPTWAKLSISNSQTTCASGDTITFQASSDLATGYTIGIDKDSTRIVTEGMPNGTYSFKLSSGGSYSAYVTAYNSAGYVDSERVYFSVYDKAPSDVKVWTDKSSYKVGEEIKFNFSSTNALRYTIGIDDANGNRIDTQLTDKSNYTKKIETAGKYSCYITAHNGIGLTDSQRIYFNVYNGVPEKPSPSITKTEFTPDETVVIKWNATKDTDSYWLHIYKNGEDYVNKSINQNLSYSYKYPVGEYTAYIVSCNGLGETLSSVSFKVVDMVTVTFDANGGSCSPTSKVVKSGSTYGDLPNATREGYTFNGWYTEKNGGTQVTKDTKVNTAKNHPLYAHWAAKTISVKFYRNLDENDTGTVTETFTYGVANQKFGYKPDGSGRYSPMSDAKVGFGGWTKTGYQMLGWSTQRNSNVNYSTYSGVSNDWINSNSPSINLYAQWSPNQYTLVVNPNGGTYDNSTSAVTKSPKLIYDSGNWNAIGKATRTGYNLTGYFTSASGGTKVYDENGNCIESSFWKDKKYKNTGNLTVYAQWTAIGNIKVTLNPNGGTCSKDSITVVYDGKYTGLVNADRKGYTFDGWYTESGAKVTTDTVVKNLSPHTLYAHWKAKNITVNFYRNLDGNDTGCVTETFTYDVANQKFGYKTDGTGRYSPMNNEKVGFGAWTKTGYQLLGWSTQKNSSVNYSTYSGVSNDWINSNSPAINLYAQWKANQYTVKLDANGSSASPESITVSYDGTYSNLPEPTKTGYNFNGWHREKDKDTQVFNTDKVTITSDLTLYAHWSQERMMISFNANGGTSETKAKYVTYDNTFGVLPTATKTGYTFEGWYLDEKFTSLIIESTIVKITGNQSVYAKWNLQKFTIKFDANGGTAETSGKQVIFSRTYGVLPIAEKDNDVFVGWFTKDGTEVTPNTVVTLSGDTVLYAKWQSEIKIEGDVNSDGVLDANDVKLLQNYLHCKETFTKETFETADLNGDGKVNVVDLAIMKRSILRKNGDK